MNIHTHFWGVWVVVLLAALHVLDLLDLLPSQLFHLSHHPIFSPSALPLPAAGSRFASSKIGSVAQQALRRLQDVFRRADASTAGASQAVQLSDLLSYALPSRAMQIATAWSRPPSWMDVLGFGIFFTGAFFCLGFSATFHCLQSHSQHVAKKCNQLDYVGIVVMICGSFVPALHYGFHCHSHIQAAYTVSILALGAVAIVFVIAPTYATPAYRPIRTAIFIALGLFAVVPVLHVVSMYGVSARARCLHLRESIHSIPCLSLSMTTWRA